MAKFVNLESITKYINATFKAENHMIFKKRYILLDLYNMARWGNYVRRSD